MFRSLLVFWLIVADSFLVTLISASLWELFAGIERKQSKLPCESPTMVRFQEENGSSQLKL